MISVFDMFSIGIGPSSSHTVGPMRAAFTFCELLKNQGPLESIDEVVTELFGSLGQTGKGHGTGKAVILGLLGYEPESVPVQLVDKMLLDIENSQALMLLGEHKIKFPKQNAIVFHRRKTLPLHANAMTLRAFSKGEAVLEKTYYSIGGGFIVEEADFATQKNEKLAQQQIDAPFPFSKASELLSICQENGFSISSLMIKNETAFMPETELRSRLVDIWQVMQECVQNGISTEGILPGGLKVHRRASALHRRLLNEHSTDPMLAMDWVNLFALAVNEENAAGGRVVTAPTNGAAGIIPAVLHYFDKFIRPVDDDTVCRYLLTAAAIGILYKKNASISGAEVGCQGEVGVACSMAAGALTEILGGSIHAVENAAEIGMEHNLGLTCDPVGGLVQVPCIERNAMGAIKAINASRLAVRGTGNHKVSLDKVIKTMWDTGNDMKTKYKETARGGLAVNIIEC
ncbi:L-serine ammonia-lyase [Glaciecola sp. KUL10]|uniref:L-serine ammonia-lyase n=1 Tax=Glaciecola sp. (strain KUL10) TaxID=2161813 RepID=UPI000D78C2C6|nr:L-serine ammonia-lyase [Glaciecola sp. KUL10]GBL02769.1 L-serine dehydratase [Glaciecola sp. KUL10]